MFIAGPLPRSHLAPASGRPAHPGLAEALRFRLQIGWRVEAVHLIDALPIFADLPEEQLSDLAGRVQLHAFPAGKPVFHQGDVPDAFFIVRRGVFQVIEEDPDSGTSVCSGSWAEASPSASWVSSAGPPERRP